MTKRAMNRGGCDKSGSYEGAEAREDEVQGDKSSDLSSVPEFLAIGHVTRDLSDAVTFSPGGTVTFASLCAARLGFSSAIVTSAGQGWLETVSSSLSGIPLHAHVSTQTTTFSNRYVDGFRTQYLYERAEMIRLVDVPESWFQARIVLFGPVAQEMDVEFVTGFPRSPGTVFAATPQGWLRRWEADGRVWPTAWNDAQRVLPLLDVLILSHDDLLPFADGERTAVEALLQAWSELVPLLIATDGRHGATLFSNGVVQQFPAYPAAEIDPTGAGDVFAAAFLVHLARHGNSAEAVDFANCTASLSIEHVGMQGIPTLAEVQQRLRMNGKA